MTKVYVEGRDPLLIRMFEDEGFEVCQMPQDADLICMEGGEDVDPTLYGEKASPQTYSSQHKDIVSLGILAIAELIDIPVVGVCRGHQIMCVQQGGKMIQHIENHGRSHTVELEGVEYNMTSAHHQEAVPALHEDYIVRADDGTCEIVLYPDKPWLGFQAHPEYVGKGHECRELFFDLLEKQCGVSRP